MQIHCLKKIDFRIDIQGLVGATVRDMVALTRKIITAEPTVDAVEVVRCKDCKRCFKHTTKRNRQKMWICMRNDVDLFVRPDDFCSYGERKDGDGNG